MVGFKQEVPTSLCCSSELLQIKTAYHFKAPAVLIVSCTASFNPRSCSSSSLCRRCQRWFGRRSERSIPCHNVPAAPAAGRPRWRSWRKLFLRLLVPQLVLPELLSLLTGLCSARTRVCLAGLQPACLLLPRCHSGSHAGGLWHRR